MSGQMSERERRSLAAALDLLRSALEPEPPGPPDPVPCDEEYKVHVTWHEDAGWRLCHVGQGGVEWDLLPSVRRHLRECPACKEATRLRLLEAMHANSFDFLDALIERGRV